MSKLNKKIEKTIVKQLTNVCEEAKFKLNGFVWLTHFVNYAQFPESLNIVIVFERQQDITDFKHTVHERWLLNLVGDELKSANIVLKGIAQHVTYDSEEACLNSPAHGDWQKRWRL